MKMKPAVFAWCGLFLALAATFVLRLPHINLPIWNEDEGIYGTVAAVMTEGGLPYKHAWIDKPPMTYYMYKAVFSIYGRNNMTASHFANIIWICLGIVLLFALAWKLKGPRVAAFSAVLYAIFSTTYKGLDMLPVNMEFLMTPFLVGGALCFWQGVQTDGLLWLSLAGILVSLATLTKQPGFFTLLFMAGFVPLNSWKSPLSYRKIILHEMALIGGFMLTMAGILGLYRYQGIAGDFINQSLLSGLKFIGSKKLGLGQLIFDGLNRTFDFTMYNFLFWILAGAALIYVAYELFTDRADPGTGDRAGNLFLVMWFAFSVMAVSLGGRFYGHYYLMIFPCMAILAGIGADALWGSRKYIPSALSVLVTGFLVLLFSLGIAIPVIKFQKEFFREKAEKLTYREYKIADFIRQHTQPQDKIFVWGSFSEIYLLSDRLPASRYFFFDIYNYVSDQDLAKPTPQSTIYRVMGEISSDLSKSLPLYIIDTSTSGTRNYGHIPMQLHPQLEQLLTDHYDKAEVIERVTLYRRKGCET